MAYEIDISCSDVTCDPDQVELRKALEFGLQLEQVTHAVLSVTIVDNVTMQRLNRDHLQHDYATDVNSFPLEWTCGAETPGARGHLSSGRAAGAAIEGEIVAGGQYAGEMSARCGWSPQNELTLYVIHGMLHICGYDDLTDTEKKYMRARERAVLEGLGLSPRYPDDDLTADAPVAGGDVLPGITPASSPEGPR